MKPILQQINKLPPKERSRFFEWANRKIMSMKTKLETESEVRK